MYHGYETHAEMVNDIARYILAIFAVIRAIYAEIGFTPKLPLG